MLNYHEVEGDLASAVERAFGRRFASVIEASGSPLAAAAAIDLAAVGAKILVTGDYGESCAAFRWNDLLHREVELIGSNASAGAWDEAAELAVTGGLPLERLVTTRLRAEEFARGVELVRSSRREVKVVLVW
jgi:threonine dehydrogenase-like Zn-dependent dehydrogenase